VSYNADLRPDGLFTISNIAGHVLLDGGFRHDIPETLRMKTLLLVTEAPAMLETLQVTAGLLDAVQRELCEKLGVEQAEAQAPWLFAILDRLSDQIKAAGQ
jgi:hypothetical protein